ncbi:MAG: hypothetical protein IJ705_01725 [Oscillospiraceae bacterium]|nr:hypothetical protein [Oscillospiraceae bacterium]
MAKLCLDTGNGTQAKTNADAALFTQITAETEDWKIPEEPKRAKPVRSYKQKQILLCSAGAGVFALLVVLLILFIQPVNRVIRAINAGEYAQAKEIYWGNRDLASGAYDEDLDAVLLRAAEKVTEQYAGREIDRDSAASALANLGAIGTKSEALLSDHFDEFRSYLGSRDHMAEAERLSDEGNYLGARKEYLLVLEGDVNYAAATEKAQACLELYAESVMSEADILIQSGDYATAILAMEKGRQTLLGYEYFNERLSYKLNASYELFENDLLNRAKALAAGQDFSGAAALLRKNMNRISYETETLTAAEADYLALASSQALNHVADEAAELYAEGDREGAFALLDEAAANPEAPAEEAAAAVAALEERFASDSIAEARTAFARDRDSLPNAIALLNDALHIRRLDAIEDYRAEISQYLPANLSEVEYAEKNGVIFRTAGSFEALSGVSYEKGWIWGEDGASVTFELNGVYDLLEGSFTVRRDDDANVMGYCEIFCDGELAYTSPELRHVEPETIPLSLNVSGCKIMTVVFHNDYSVRTADDGYCYHGICDVFLTKNIG